MIVFCVDQIGDSLGFLLLVGSNYQIKYASRCCFCKQAAFFLTVGSYWALLRWDKRDACGLAAIDLLG